MSEQQNATPSATAAQQQNIESAPPTQPISNVTSMGSVGGIPIHRLSIPTTRHNNIYNNNTNNNNNYNGDTSSNIMYATQIPPHTAARVLKGEIHNVLTVMRADPRYKYVSPHRFEMELVFESPDNEHPLLNKFRDLHATLCAWESAPQSTLPDPLLYLPAFCEAIQGRDINASVTGAALSALHKFLLYGFLTNDNSPTASASARQGMTWMSTALLQCTFEESNMGSGMGGTGGGGAAAAGGGTLGGGGGGTAKYFEPGAGLGSSTHGAKAGSSNAMEASSSRPSIRRNISIDPTRQPSSIQHHGNGHARDGANTSRTVVGTMMLHDDEQVVLKLLELSALVVRCSLHPSEPLVSTDLILGLLDTCLHVSHRAKQASPLLKSAAADSLGQIVLQVFSAITSPTRASAWGRSNTMDTADTQDQDAVQFAQQYRNNTAVSNDDMEDDAETSPLLHTRKAILLKLTNLLNPQLNNDATCATSLTLMNMAFETLREDFTEPEIAILQDDFCKYLLQWSTTHDLMILNLTLRVIFNLFQSMRNHLKVPLEVFLTSVHLRILDPTSSATNEEREVALESLLEFCQEVALMQDIYLNYDCDISCTNLYEAICTTLGRVACADGTNKPVVLQSSGTTLPTTVESITTNSSDHQSPAAIAMGNFRSQPSVRHLGGKPGTGASDADSMISDLSSHGGASAAGGGKSVAAPASSQPQTQIPLNILNKLALDGILAILDSIFRRCQSHLRYEDMMNNNNNTTNGHHRTNTGLGDMSLDEASTAGSLATETDLGNMRSQMAPHEDVLQERKIKKHFLTLIAKEFNNDVCKDKWISLAKEHKILPAVPLIKDPKPTDKYAVHPLGVAPEDVAALLYTTQSLDKANIGEYVSKGPAEKYPFHAQVLQHFVHRYDFSTLTFAGALRKFLSKFRLPGEAQCIDRLMDAFAKELHEQQKGRRQTVETITEGGDIKEGTAEGNEDGDEGGNKKKTTEFFFNNSDAVFVLSFSTIMLNTDLHNPSMKRNRRMTLEQFIRNNRGINDGEDFPVEFMTELYNQIKHKEIQVNAEVEEFFSMTQTMMDASTAGSSKNVQEAFRASWEGVLSSRRENAAQAFFTSPYTARQSIERAGVHDKEMFITIANCGAVQSLATVFARSWDDELVVRALRGLKQMAKMCEFFETDDILNEILIFQLVLGRDYIKGCTALEHSGYDNGAPILPNGRMPMAVIGDDHDESAIIDTESPVPNSLLCTPKGVDPLHASFAVHMVRGLASGSSGDEDDEGDMGIGDDDETEAGDDAIDVTGSAAHRGLLALDTAFLMLRSYAPRVTAAWPAFIDCICALRDARGLPAGLSDLDDFADSNGNVLPLSQYAIMSQKRLDDHYRLLLGKDDSKEKKGWLRSFWGQKKQASSRDSSVIGSESERSTQSGTNNSDIFIAPPPKELSTFSLRLLDVAENCEVEKVVVQMGASTGNEDEESPEHVLQNEQQFQAIEALLTSVDEYPFNDNPVLEQHAIFSLELAARALLTNRDRAPELFSLFLLKFEHIFSKVGDTKIPAPFMVERVVVTVLRSSIHLYDLPEVSRTRCPWRAKYACS